MASMDLYETVLSKAKDAGAVEPVIGDMSGEACVVDTDNGKVYRLVLEEIESD